MKTGNLKNIKSVTIGGTGMLSAATKWLANEHGPALIVARHASEFIKKRQRSNLIPLNGDWKVCYFMDYLKGTLNSYSKLEKMLIWIYNPVNRLPKLLLLSNSVKVVAVFGGQTNPHVQLAERHWLMHNENK